MKVVINDSCGGFGLSGKATHWIAARLGVPCYFYASSYDRVMGRKYTLLSGYPEETDAHFWIASSTNNPDEIDYKTNVLEYYELPRHDPVLIAVVEALGEEANGDCQLKVVDIPDGVDYIIQSGDDGSEWIAEKHRTWY